MKKIVFDCLGGDGGLPVMLDGAILALQQDPTLQLVLVGDASVIQPQVAAFGARVEIIDTKENIGMEEHPTEAVRQKKNSSLVLGLNQLKTRDDCGAFLSAGSTGAVLTGGFMYIGRAAGISRPALCPELPTQVAQQTAMVVDCGANMDCTPVQLLHFAVMANEYKKAMGLVTPRVALLNVGTESTKGNELVKQTHELLTKLHQAKLLNFVGNIEANQVVQGVADIVVTDGFSGNVLLKSTEGMSKFMFKAIKQIAKQSLFTKLGGLLLRKPLRRYKEEKINTQAASIFLGLKKPVLKMHGNAVAETVAKALAYAASMVDLNLNEKITAAVMAAEACIANDVAGSTTSKKQGK